MAGENETLGLSEIVEGGYTRTQMRSLIFHLLYIIEGYEYDQPLSTAIENLNRGYDQKVPADGHIAHVTQEIIDKREYLDASIQSVLENWRLSRLGICTRLILRIGVWELLFTDTPSNIVINEAIELAKDFAEKDAYKFINGVLDQVATKRDELKSKSSEPLES